MTTDTLQTQQTFKVKWSKVKVTALRIVSSVKNNKLGTHRLTYSVLHTW